MNQRLIDTSEWPLTANLSQWAILLGLSSVTIRKYRLAGKLPGKKQLNGVVLVNKQTVLECFNIKHQPEAAAAATKGRK